MTTCHDPPDHLGCSTHVEYKCLDATHLDIVNNADESWIRVVDCHVDYDDNTMVGRRAQWGSTKTANCFSCTIVAESTIWGHVKA